MYEQYGTEDTPTPLFPPSSDGSATLNAPAGAANDAALMEILEQQTAEDIHKVGSPQRDEMKKVIGEKENGPGFKLGGGQFQRGEGLLGTDRDTRGEGRLGNAWDSEE